MKKLLLRVDALAVESFPTVQVPGPQELAATKPAACDPFSVPPRCS